MVDWFLVLPFLVRARPRLVWTGMVVRLETMKTTCRAPRHDPRPGPRRSRIGRERPGPDRRRRASGQVEFSLSLPPLLPLTATTTPGSMNESRIATSARSSCSLGLAGHASGGADAGDDVRHLGRRQLSGRRGGRAGPRQCRRGAVGEQRAALAPGVAPAEAERPREGGQEAVAGVAQVVAVLAGGVEVAQEVEPDAEAEVDRDVEDVGAALAGAALDDAADQRGRAHGDRAHDLLGRAGHPLANPVDPALQGPALLCQVTNVLHADLHRLFPLCGSEVRPAGHRPLDRSCHSLTHAGVAAGAPVWIVFLLPMASSIWETADLP